MTKEQVQKMQFQQALLSALLAPPEEVHAAVEKIRQRTEQAGDWRAARECAAILKEGA